MSRSETSAKAAARPISYIQNPVRNRDINFGPQRIPYPQSIDVLPSKYIEKASPQEVETAAHELNHALVAYVIGVPVDEVIVERKGNSLGRTTFSGHMDPETFKLIAAAGAVSTPHGKASGFGMDMLQMQVLAERYGGRSPAEAISYASTILSNFDQRIVKRAAEIMAGMKKINGYFIPHLLSLAQHEIEQEEMMNDGKSFTNFGEQREQLVRMNEELEADRAADPEMGMKGEKTQVIETKEGYIMIHTKDGLLVNEVQICKMCGGENGHTQDCMYNEQRDKKDNTFSSKPSQKFKETKLYKEPLSESQPDQTQWFDNYRQFRKH